jgi:thioredoxin 2
MTHTFRCAVCGRLNRVDATREGSARCGQCKSAIDVQNRPFTVDDAGLSALVASSPVPVLVDFYSDSCGPCRQLAPILEQLGAARRGEVLVAKVDTARHQRTAAALGVSGIPAMFVFRDGKVVDQTVGLQPLRALDALVARHVG